MRVVIAEDSVLLREGLARLLADGGIEVVAQVGDGPGLGHDLSDTVYLDEAVSTWLFAQRRGK